MDIKVITASLPSTTADAILVDLFESNSAPAGEAGSVDKG